MSATEEISSGRTISPMESLPNAANNSEANEATLSRNSGNDRNESNMISEVVEQLNEFNVNATSPAEESPKSSDTVAAAPTTGQYNPSKKNPNIITNQMAKLIRLKESGQFDKPKEKVTKAKKVKSSTDSTYENYPIHHKPGSSSGKSKQRQFLYDDSNFRMPHLSIPAPVLTDFFGGPNGVSLIAEYWQYKQQFEQMEKDLSYPQGFPKIQTEQMMEPYNPNISADHLAYNANIFGRSVDTAAAPPFSRETEAAPAMLLPSQSPSLSGLDWLAAHRQGLRSGSDATDYSDVGDLSFLTARSSAAAADINLSNYSIASHNSSLNDVGSVGSVGNLGSVGSVSGVGVSIPTITRRYSEDSDEDDALPQTLSQTQTVSQAHAQAQAQVQEAFTQHPSFERQQHQQQQVSEILPVSKPAQPHFVPLPAPPTAQQKTTSASKTTESASVAVPPHVQKHLENYKQLLLKQSKQPQPQAQQTTARPPHGQQAARPPHGPQGHSYSYAPPQSSSQLGKSGQPLLSSYSAHQEPHYQAHGSAYDPQLRSAVSTFAQQIDADFQEFAQPTWPRVPAHLQHPVPPQQPAAVPKKAFGYAQLVQQYGGGAIAQSGAPRKIEQHAEFVYIVEFKRKRTEFLISTSCVDQITVGDVVMVTTSDKSGLDMGVLVEILPMAVFLSTSRRNLVAHPLSSILRRAWETEKRSIVQKLRDESEVQQYASELSYEAYKLNILVVDAEYQFDRKKLTLYYQRTSVATGSLKLFMNHLSGTFSATVCMERV